MIAVAVDARYASSISEANLMRFLFYYFLFLVLPTERIIGSLATFRSNLRRIVAR